MNEAFRGHVERLAGTTSMREVASVAGLQVSTLARQLKGEVKVGTVVAICRAYSAPLLPAFVAAGFITAEEAVEAAAGAELVHATDRQLAEEILRRVIDAEEHSELTEPLDDERVSDAVELSNVRRLNVGRPPETLTDEELEARYGDRIAADRSDPEQDLDARTP